MLVEPVTGSGKNAALSNQASLPASQETALRDGQC